MLLSAYVFLNLYFVESKFDLILDTSIYEACLGVVSRILALDSPAVLLTFLIKPPG